MRYILALFLCCSTVYAGMPCRAVNYSPPVTKPRPVFGQLYVPSPWYVAQCQAIQAAQLQQVQLYQQQMILQQLYYQQQILAAQSQIQYGR